MQIFPTTDGIVTVDVVGNVAQDLAGNNNTVASQFTLLYDGTAPVLSEITPVTTPGNDATPSYTFSSTEA